VCDLWKGAMLSELQWPISSHYLTLNISEMAKDITIVVVNANRKPYPGFQIVPFSMILNDP